MRQIVYAPKLDRLVYLDEKATPEFWDARWRAEGRPSMVNSKDDVVVLTRRYLSSGAKVLEGGCGRANKVKAMQAAGFKAVGVDFAAESVREARQHYPDLDIRQGDVRSLDFVDGYFDGYWSIGVIEHFWNGYDPILAEAARVIRPDGVLFLTAPWFSPYRKYKARRGGYALKDFEGEPNSFYQFALGTEEIRAQLAHHGFQLLIWRGRASEISMAEDMDFLKRPIDWLLGSRGSVPKRVLRRVVSRALDPFCGHSFLAVARRKV